MEKKYPYQVLMETKGLTKNELTSNSLQLVKKFEATLRSVTSFGKEDENGNIIISDTVKSKLVSLDKEIVDSIWDDLEEKAKSETKIATPIETPIETPIVTKIETPKSEQKQESSGKIGFFEF